MPIKPKQPPHIGKILKAYVREKRISQAGWARQQGIGAQQVARYLKRPDQRIGTLFTISQVLKHNFLREIADQLPAEFPPHHENPLSIRVAELEKENEMLKMQVDLLKEVLGKN